jgi:HlyD family secretion protein
MIQRVLAWVRAHPVWSGLLALVLVGLLWLIFKPSKPSYEYVSQTADRGEVVAKVTASGKLRALNTIKVGAEVSGQILRVFVDFNSQVTAGQVLAEIDPTRFRARVQQGQAQVSLAQAALLQAEANAARAQTDYQIQQREFGRRRELEAGGFVSKSGLDTATSQLASARASVKATAAQMASARAQIAQANAELASAQLDMRRTRIIAPTSGVVINKLVEPGTTVAASFQTPNLFEIAADTTRMQVEASVDEADIGQVRPNQQVRFTVDAYPDEGFAASVRQIRKASTEVQNVVSYLVILDVANPEGKLLPGMTANVEIITGRAGDVLRVPTMALRFRPRAVDMPKGKDKPDPDKPTVFLVSDDPYKPTARQVKTGLAGEDYIEIKQGLRPGDKLIIRSRSTVKKKASEDAEESGDDGDNATS